MDLFDRSLSFSKSSFVIFLGGFNVFTIRLELEYWIILKAMRNFWESLLMPEANSEYSLVQLCPS